jgi:hypothetical protein
MKEHTGYCEAHESLTPHYCGAPCCAPPSMRDLAEAAVARGELGTFDYALPQTWADDVKRVTGEWPRGIVWSYPPQGQPNHIWGEPYALTEEGQRILDLYSERLPRYEPR